MADSNMVPNPNRNRALPTANLSLNQRRMIVDRENGIRRDDNPYPYPDFHSDGTAPLLYELVVKFASSLQEEEEEHVKTRKRIQSRCLVMPQEVMWRDSCGETALHRLCQVPVSIVDNELHVKAVVEVAKLLVEACPLVVSIQNNWKETSLFQFATHCAVHSCSTNTKEQTTKQEEPCLYLETVMELVRLLSSNAQVASWRNYLGALPLHVACELPQGVILEEELECDKNDGQGHCNTQELSNNMTSVEWTRVIHVAIVKHLLKQNPQAVHTPDDAGTTPLHHAVTSKTCSSQVVQVLLEHLLNNDASDEEQQECDETSKSSTETTSSSMDGEATLAHGQDKHKQLLHNVMEALWKAYNSDNDNDTSDNQNYSSMDFVLYSLTIPILSCNVEFGQEIIRNCKWGRLWNKTILLLKVNTTMSLTRDDDDWTFCHSALNVAAPLGVVMLSLSLYPNELTQRPRHQTPLSLIVSMPFLYNVKAPHGVAQTKIPNPLMLLFLWRNSQQKLPPDNPLTSNDLIRHLLIQQMLDTNAQIAAIVDNGNGRLPLHDAIENGIDWDYGLQLLFRAEPRAISTRDPVTRLYPFALAAATADKGNDNHESTSAEDARQVSIIYELLRLDPSVVAFS